MLISAGTYGRVFGLLSIKVLVLSLTFLFAAHGMAVAQKADSLWVKQLLDSAYALETTDGAAALSVYNEAIRVSKDVNYTLGLAKATHYSGIVYSDKSQYAQALNKYREAQDIYRTINNTRGIGACYTNIGNVYRFQGELDSALVNYQHALEIFRKFGHQVGLSQAYGNVGGMFQEMKQFQKAYDYHSLSIVAATKSDDSLALCRALINQGTALNDLKRLDESAAAHESALKIAKAIGDDYGVQLAYINLADCYKQKQDYAHAISYGEAGLYYAMKLATPFDIADVKKRLGDIYAANQEFSKARGLYLDAIKICKEIHAKGILVNAYNSLHKVLASMGDYREAYHFLDLAQQSQDSVMNEKQLEVINEMEVKFHSLQKDQALASQKLELQKSRQYITYSIAVAVILMLSILLFYVYYQNRRKNHQRQLKEISQEQELQVLHALMRGEEKERVRIASGLHDEVSGVLAAAKMHLSSLGSSESIGTDSSYKQTVSLLDEASASIRKTAHNLMPEVLLQYGLDRALQRYCANIGSERNLTIQYDSWGEAKRFIGNFELSVYRIVQELLNNMVKHSGATEGLVQVSLQNDILSITVEDNGVGLNKDGASGHGMGLASLRSRVQTLNGRIDITSESGSGVSAYLEFDTRSVVLESVQ